MTTPDRRVAVYEPRYNQRGLLLGEHLVVGANRNTATSGKRYDEGAGSKRNEAIAEIRHNAKGQRLFLKLGSGTITQYAYDPLTFRLRQLRTTRPTYDPPFPQYRADLQDPKLLQQLLYTYDPVGNITEITDEAYKPAFFQNALIEPRSVYEYDALYRLTKASGREDGAATGSPPQIEGGPLKVSFPVMAANALRKYTQEYEYDSVGNIEQMIHLAGALGSWTRRYDYASDSNRLLHTWEGDDNWNSGNATNRISYKYDAHGNMLNLADVAPGQFQRWDQRDMIASLDLNGGGDAFYQYDAGKQRTRKTLVRNNSNIVEERIYLGGLELYRRRLNGVLVEEIETLHLFDGEHRLLMVDQVIKTDRAELGIRNLYRYTLSNHLGSSTVEVDENADIISYEEYHPYGTTAYQSGRNAAEVKLKRYRYTGMERDEESGLSYHGARYYASWLARWASPDPIGTLGSESFYQYARSRPTTDHDRNGMQSAYFAVKEPEPATPWYLRSWERTKQDFRDLSSYISDDDDKTGPPSAPVPLTSQQLSRTQPKITLPEIEWHAPLSEFDRQLNEAKRAVVGVALTIDLALTTTDALFPAAVALPLVEGTALGRKATGMAFEEFGTASLLRKGENFLGKEAVARGLQMEAEILQSRLGSIGGKTGQIYEKQTTVLVGLVKDEQGQYKKVVSAGGFDVPDLASKSKVAKALDLKNPPEIIGTTHALTPIRTTHVRSALPPGIGPLDAEQKFRYFISNPNSSGGPTPIAGGVSRNACLVCQYVLDEVGGTVDVQNSSRQIIFPYDPR